MTEQEEINFEELEQDFSNKEVVEEQQINESIVSDVEEVKPGSNGPNYTFLKMPKPGESITLTLEKIEKKAGRSMKRKSDGKQFDTGLLNKKTGKRVEFHLITDKNESLQINGWGLYYSILGSDSPVEKKAIKQGSSYKGITFKLTHVLNGQHGSLDVNDLKAIKGYSTIEEAQKYKDMIIKAIEDRTIYKVELVE